MGSGDYQSVVYTTLCEIIKEPKYDEALLVLTKTHIRFHELDQAIDWALARNPNFFPSLGDGYHIWKTAELVGFPKFRILYHYDEGINTVTLISIQEVENDK